MGVKKQSSFKEEYLGGLFSQILMETIREEVDDMKYSKEPSNSDSQFFLNQSPLKENSEYVALGKLGSSEEEVDNSKES